jgi:hypothetical protein
MSSPTIQSPQKQSLIHANSKINDKTYSKKEKNELPTKSVILHSSKFATDDILHHEVESKPFLMARFKKLLCLLVFVIFIVMGVFILSVLGSIGMITY